MTEKEKLIKKLVDFFFNGIFPSNKDITAFDDLYIDPDDPLEGIYKRAVDLYLTKIDQAYTQGYMTEDQHSKEMKSITLFKPDDCESASKNCNDKITTLIRLYQHNKGRYRKIWRPFAKKYGFTRGGKRPKSKRKHRGKVSTRRRVFST